MIVTDLMFMSIISVMRVDAAWWEEMLLPWVVQVSVLRVVFIPYGRWRVVFGVVFGVVDAIVVNYVFIPFVGVFIRSDVSVWITVIEMFDWVVCI